MQADAAAREGRGLWGGRGAIEWAAEVEGVAVERRQAAGEERLSDGWRLATPSRSSQPPCLSRTCRASVEVGDRAARPAQEGVEAAAAAAAGKPHAPRLLWKLKPPGSAMPVRAVAARAP